MILMKNKHLGRCVQFYAYLLTLPATTPSSETNNSIINFAFVTILNDTIIYMTINLIVWLLKTHIVSLIAEKLDVDQNALIVNLLSLIGYHTS